jgi:hypothetical protein
VPVVGGTTLNSTDLLQGIASGPLFTAQGDGDNADPVAWGSYNTPSTNHVTGKWRHSMVD